MHPNKVHNHNINRTATMLSVVTTIDHYYFRRFNRFGSLSRHINDLIYYIIKTMEVVNYCSTFDSLETAPTDGVGEGTKQSLASITIIFIILLLLLLSPIFYFCIKYCYILKNFRLNFKCCD